MVGNVGFQPGPLNLEVIAPSGHRQEFSGDSSIQSGTCPRNAGPLAVSASLESFSPCFLSSSSPVCQQILQLYHLLSPLPTRFGPLLATQGLPLGVPASAFVCLLSVSPLCKCKPLLWVALLVLCSHQGPSSPKGQIVFACLPGLTAPHSQPHSPLCFCSPMSFWPLTNVLSSQGPPLISCPEHPLGSPHSLPSVSFSGRQVHQLQALKVLVQAWAPCPSCRLLVDKRTVLKSRSKSACSQNTRQPVYIFSLPS